MTDILDSLQHNLVPVRRNGKAGGDVVCRGDLFLSVSVCRYILRTGFPRLPLGIKPCFIPGSNMRCPCSLTSLLLHQKDDACCTRRQCNSDLALADGPQCHYQGGMLTRSVLPWYPGLHP